LAKLDGLLIEPEVIACGEIGLDYYHEGAPQEVQRAGLIAQLEIAAARKRPILIHCRPTGDGANGVMDAWDDLFWFLKNIGVGPAWAANALLRRGLGASARSLDWGSFSPLPEI